MKKHIALFIGFLAMAPELPAELTVDPIYQSYMVLQQGVEVPISGASTSSGDVTVSFGDQKVTAKVKNKKWQAVLAPMPASSEGRSLTITQGKDEIALSDVLVGEVWFASGQSNMLFRLDETPDKAALSHPEIPAFRYYHAEPQVLPSNKPYTPEQINQLKTKDMYRGAWAVSGGAGSTTRMSAVGWYFGRKLQATLGVPVGVIHTSLGGSEMAAWMPNAVLKKKYKECLTPRWMDSKCKYVPAWARSRGEWNIGKTEPSAPHPFKPGYLFETGVTPWLRFPVAGVIWYQGETDAEEKDQKRNTDLLTDMITGWRKEFGRPELPFLMVQLPRLNDKSPLRAYWPEFREVQQRVSESLPQVFFTATIDLGSTNADVHPKRKLEVGERLAALAAARVYGKELPFSGPAYKASALKDGKVEVSFDYAEGLKTLDGKEPVGFELSADGKSYSPATAELQGDTILLSSPAVKSPKYVRYAWATFLAPNLVNAAKLPAVPFASVVGGGKAKKTKETEEKSASSAR